MVGGESFIDCRPRSYCFACICSVDDKGQKSLLRLDTFGKAVQLLLCRLFSKQCVEFDGSFIVKVIASLRSLTDSRALDTSEATHEYSDMVILNI